VVVLRQGFQMGSLMGPKMERLPVAELTGHLA
jgi:hypothetical protein